ncbi:MAG: hypothetical protein B7Z20_04845 [Sphingobium sp. 32-64-5]|nr:MAG: hypothetical protein B7Z20_04845 [Sphingobium sp. 32-64-5]
MFTSPDRQLHRNKQVALKIVKELLEANHWDRAPLYLTERQRDCVIWVARGKTDWEIARILGLSHETVTEYLKRARERYGVGKRTLLAVHALFDGTISFNDVMKR